MAVNKPARKFRPKPFKASKWNPSEFTISVILFGPFLLYMLFKPFTLGHDDCYFQFIILPPVCIGALVFYVWNWQDVLNLIRQKSMGIKEQLWKAAALVLFALSGLLCGFCILGVPAMAVWEYCNMQAANKNPIEVISCPVDRFYFRRGSSISFTFRSHYEHINGTYKSLQRYKDENPDNYKVVLTCREGIWNYYVVEDWDVVRKSE